MITETEKRYLENQANTLRMHSLRMTTRAGSGHPTSCLSAAEIMSVLFFRTMRYDPQALERPENDELVLSKGHAAPILYAALAEAGAMPLDSLEGLRAFDSPLEGHPVPRVPGVRIATGSLGQGLSGAVGLALAARWQDGAGADDGAGNRLPRIYALLGDGELAEGQVAEALDMAPRLGLSNLCAIVDVNRLGQSGPTRDGWDLELYAARGRASGWQVITVDGHSVSELAEAFFRASGTRRPTLVLARTTKGKGVGFLEDRDGHHGKALAEEDLGPALEAIESRMHPQAQCVPANLLHLEAEPGERAEPEAAVAAVSVSPRYRPGERVATRDAYGEALASLARQDPRIVVLDGDVRNSTRVQRAFDAAPQAALECYIAEQNMIGVALGLQARGRRVFAATFAAFLTRAFDQIRMAAYSRADLKLAGSHAGVGIGRDGPSQMGLEDVAMMRTVPGSLVVSPADAVAARRLTAVCAGYQGISYLRLARQKTPVLYGNDEEFPPGGSKVLRASAGDRATIVAAGATVPEALAAADELAAQGIAVRVIDCYSLKPLDGATLSSAARETGRIITVEDHVPEGGLGEAVSAAVAGLAPVEILAVKKLPHSGSGEELYREQGIDAAAIRRRLAG